MLAFVFLFVCFFFFFLTCKEKNAKDLITCLKREAGRGGTKGRKQFYGKEMCLLVFYFFFKQRYLENPNTGRAKRCIKYMHITFPQIYNLSQFSHRQILLAENILQN